MPRKVFFLPLLAAVWAGSCALPIPSSSMPQAERDIRFGICAACLSFMAVILWILIDDMGRKT